MAIQFLLALVIFAANLAFAQRTAVWGINTDTLLQSNALALVAALGHSTGVFNYPLFIGLGFCPDQCAQPGHLESRR
jgi:hypothetical protein